MGFWGLQPDPYPIRPASRRTAAHQNLGTSKQREYFTTDWGNFGNYDSDEVIQNVAVFVIRGLILLGYAGTIQGLSRIKNPATGFSGTSK